MQNCIFSIFICALFYNLMDIFIRMPRDRRPQALHKSLPQRDNVRPKNQGLEVNFATQTLKTRRQIIKGKAVRKGRNSSNTIAAVTADG